jgi:hypothetical protein
MTTSVGNLPYEAVTSAEKARARRLEGKGLVSIHRERDSRILRVSGRNRLVGREVYYVTPIVKSEAA